ncbi:hypothetical protein GOP47_0024717 [Adiantum capillus-veneris]|uniref:Uncharacterized protein n=1 Tax=Adiantum capillus-veneris TaxID=13818 RepID=A0A9D4U363_ADICA|nr:hypothetical protein GOP47_0024717 [Adiantum capillus-veneris]
MRFRARNYEEEEAAVCLPRQPAQHHPLGSTVPPQLSQLQYLPLQVSTAVQHFDEVPVDPLRAISAQDSLLCVPGITVQERSCPQSVLNGTLDELAETAAKDWENHRASILRRFSSNGTIKVSAPLDILSKQLKGRGKFSASAHLQELDEMRGGANDDAEIISQEEYVFRLRELNDNIADAWKNNERVATLRLAVKVAKLLSDTSTPRFYPTLFILATDILETIGNLVWRRIKGKAELDDDGKLIKPLPENFTADDIRQEAKDTCSNWFYKIGSIHELLPRIYLEITILRCLHFLQKDPPIQEFQRLNMMIRGLGDPLASAYARLYLARKGQSIFPRETGYLIVGLDDYLLLYRRVLSGEFEKTIAKIGIDKKSYVSLVEPIFDLYLQYICAFTNKEELLFIMRTFCEQQSGSNVKEFVPVSVLMHYLLRQLPAAVVSTKALDLSRILKKSVDISKPQYLNYRLLGRKLCECHPPAELHLPVLNDVWKEVSKFTDLVEYLTLADVFVEYILQCSSDNEMHALLKDIVKHLKKATPSEEALKILESIVVKVMGNASDLKGFLNMPFFTYLLDKLHGETKKSVQKQILLFISRQNQYLGDPIERDFVFNLSKSLYKSLDSLSSEDEQRQFARLISRFVQLVDFKEDVEQHLLFLVDCRGTFTTMDPVKEAVVHISNRLAVIALRVAKGKLNQHAVDFVKSCVTFNEITIPSLENVLKRILLYIASAEVALINGLISHSESLLKSLLACLQDLGHMHDARNEKFAVELLGCIQKLCSLLLLVPGQPDLGAFYLFRGLVDIIDNELRLKEPLKIEMFLGVILACNALSQDSLPYHVDSLEMISNDELFSGEPWYAEQLAQLTDMVVERIKKASIAGNEAVMACQIFAIAFECDVGDDIHEHYSTLARAAIPLLPKNSRILKFID